MALSFVDREATARLLCAYSLDGGLAFWPASSTRERSGGTVTSDAAFPLRRARVPLGIGVGVIQHSGLRDLRVHSLGPGLRSELTLQVVDSLADDLAGLGK